MTPRAARARDVARVAADVRGGARARRRARGRATRRARGRATTRGARWCATRDDDADDARVGGDDGENATTRASERRAAVTIERPTTNERGEARTSGRDSRRRRSRRVWGRFCLGITRRRATRR